MQDKQSVSFRLGAAVASLDVPQESKDEIEGLIFEMLAEAVGHAIARTKGTEPASRIDA